MTSKVSIIVPVYNTEKYLDKCLKSLVSQSYRNIEIIIVNDGSTDGSLEIINQYTSMYGEYIVAIDQENQGLSGARNTGIKCATGKYMAFIDSDDYVDKNYIMHLVEVAERENAEMVICGYQMVDEEGKLINRLIPLSYERNYREEWSCRIMAACFRLILRKVWYRYNLNFVKGIWGEDIPIVFFLNAMCDKIAVAPYAEYFYVQHLGSIRHSMKGIRDEKMPYYAIEMACSKIKKYGCKNSVAYMELSLIKIFAVFLFDLGRGAKTESIQRLCDFIYCIMNQYFEDWRERINIRFIWSRDFPMTLKLELIFFFILLKNSLLFPIGKWYCKIVR